MSRVYHKRKTWRDGWLSFRRKPSPYKRERYCEKCDRLYGENPNPPTFEKLVAGSAAGLVYLTKNWGREQLVVKFGR